MPTRARTTRSSLLLTAFLPLTARPAEIGPLPPRDRSQPASRSVRFRAEIGRVPARDCGVSGHLGQCLVGMGVVGVAHGRLGPLRRGGWFLLESPAFLAIVVCGDRAPMRNEGGAAHMGAGLWPLPTLPFRMITRFPPTRSIRECATPTTPGHTQAPADQVYDCPARLTRPPAPRTTPPGTTTLDALTHAPRRLRRPDTPH